MKITTSHKLVILNNMVNWCSPALLGHYSGSHGDIVCVPFDVFNMRCSGQYKFNIKTWKASV